MLTDGRAQTVKDLYLAGLLTKDEARSALQIANQSGAVSTTNVTEWPRVTFTASDLNMSFWPAWMPTFTGTGTANLNTPSKPKPTRGEEIAEVMIAFPESRKKFADLIDKAIAEEREACAKVAEGLEVRSKIDGNPSYQAYIMDVAAMIRQRGVA